MVGSRGGGLVFPNARDHIRGLQLFLFNYYPKTAILSFFYLCVYFESVCMSRGGRGGESHAISAPSAESPMRGLNPTNREIVP